MAKKRYYQVDYRVFAQNSDEYQDYSAKIKAVDEIDAASSMIDMFDGNCIVTGVFEL